MTTCAAYPASSTAATSVRGEMPGGAVMVARSVAKLTEATTSLPIVASFRSTRAAHAAHVIPRIDSSIVRAAGASPARGTAATCCIRPPIPILLAWGARLLPSGYVTERHDYCHNSG